MASSIVATGALKNEMEPGTLILKVDMAETVPHLVSTIIPVYNRPSLLSAAVESVLAQTHRPIELIIVDDGSTDSTSDSAKALAEKHPDVIICLRQENCGPGPAREAGRQLARGEFIQYLDSDDLLHPRKFERQVALLSERPDVDIVYGVTQFIDSAGTVLDDCLKWSGQDRDFLFPGLLVDSWWSTHTPLWRRALCDRIGPWSDLRYSEDWEYEARAGAAKARLARVPAVVSYHRQHPDSRETTSGRWLTSPDQLRFFSTLHACAVEAGVLPMEPEMRHFVRWVFSSARSAGRAGDAESARQLLALAQTEADGGSTDMTVYKTASRIFGWRIAASIVEGAQKLLRRKAGADTLRQSWMQEDGSE